MSNRSLRRRQASAKKKKARQGKMSTTSQAITAGTEPAPGEATPSKADSQPSQATQSPRARGERSRLGAIANWRPQYVMDIITELRKVVWPTRQDTVHLTIVVIVVSVIIGAMLGGIDIGFGWMIDNTLLR